MVYNQDFIEKVFIEQYIQNDKGLAGIFTLESSDNDDTRKTIKEIDNIQAEIVKMEEKKSSIKNKKRI